jgi:hypothetical protein
VVPVAPADRVKTSPSSAAVTASAVPVTVNTPVVGLTVLPSLAELGSLSTPSALAEGVTVRVSVGLPTLASTIAYSATP